jgi:hypothetical protein
MTAEMAGRLVPSTLSDRIRPHRAGQYTDHLSLSSEYYTGVQLRSKINLHLIIAFVFPNTLFPSTLMIMAMRSSETSVLTGIARCHIPGHILQCHRRESL